MQLRSATPPTPRLVQCGVDYSSISLPQMPTQNSAQLEKLCETTDLKEVVCGIVFVENGVVRRAIVPVTEIPQSPNIKVPEPCNLTPNDKHIRPREHAQCDRHNPQQTSINTRADSEDTIPLFKITRSSKFHHTDDKSIHPLNRVRIRIEGTTHKCRVMAHGYHMATRHDRHTSADTARSSTMATHPTTTVAVSTSRPVVTSASTGDATTITSSHKKRRDVSCVRARRDSIPEDDGAGPIPKKKRCKDKKRDKKDKRDKKRDKKAKKHSKKHVPCTTSCTTPVTGPSVVTEATSSSVPPVNITLSTANTSACLKTPAPPAKLGRPPKTPRAHLCTPIIPAVRPTIQKPGKTRCPGGMSLLRIPVRITRVPGTMSGNMNGTTSLPLTLYPVTNTSVSPSGYKGYPQCTPNAPAPPGVMPSAPRNAPYPVRVPGPSPVPAPLSARIPQPQSAPGSSSMLEDTLGPVDRQLSLGEPSVWLAAHGLDPELALSPTGSTTAMSASHVQPATRALGPRDTQPNTSPSLNSPTKDDIVRRYVNQMSMKNTSEGAKLLSLLEETLRRERVHGPNNMV